jgi:hypothetical protein
VSPPSGRLLAVLLVFIGGTVGGAALRPFGAGGIVVGALIGSLAGWMIARRVMRRLF